MKRLSKRSRPLSPYQKLVRAAHVGTSLRLSREECRQLGEMDDAIYTRAQHDDEQDEIDRQPVRRK